MKRRFGMWMTIVCILVVGVSVTKTTREFVSSNGVEAAAITSVMDATVPLMSGTTEKMEETVPEAAVPEAGAGAAAASFSLTSSDAAAYDPWAAAEASEDLSAEAEYGMEDAGEDTSSMSRAIPEAAAEKAVEETVKSPLDPVVETDGLYLDVIEEEFVYYADDFRERFETAETTAKGFRDNALFDNSNAAQTAAEQEYVLWDYELNLIYSTIRERMSQKEADELKALELEWMKDRDMYANKAVAGNSGVTAKSPDYLKKMTERTRERCYWLLEQYETVLNRKVSLRND